MKSYEIWESVKCERRATDNLFLFVHLSERIYAYV